MTFVSHATLHDALRWAAERWDEQRPAPVRLHRAHSTEGALGAPMYTHAFAAALDGRPNAVTDATRTVPCYHPLLAAGLSPRDCPECTGYGVKDVRVERYRYPMTLALSRLTKTLRQRRHPHPVRIVTALADHAWDAKATARSFDLPWDLAEALFLDALRKLHSRYEEAPVSKGGWVSLSDAQRNAILAGEVVTAA